SGDDSVMSRFILTPQLSKLIRHPLYQIYFELRNFGSIALLLDNSEGTRLAYGRLDVHPYYRVRRKEGSMTDTTKRVVDADTHIAESQGMWEFLDREMYHRRPVLMSVPEDTLYGERNAFWLIDGNIFPKPAGRGGFNLITPSAAKRQQVRTDISLGCRDLTDPEARLRDMDQLGFDVQVIYPTLFLIYLTDDPTLDVAL